MSTRTYMASLDILANYIMPFLLIVVTSILITGISAVIADAYARIEASNRQWFVMFAIVVVALCITHWGIDFGPCS